MASLIYNSGLYDALTGAIDFDTDTFKAVLVTSSYVPNKTTHTKRSDVTNEITGTGYSTGGTAATVTVTNDTGNTRVNVSLGALSVSTASITARGAVYYKSRGGASSADELVAYVDFGSDITSTNATWAATASTLRVTN